jgi:Domain of unknown function (DUF4349)
MKNLITILLILLLNISAFTGLGCASLFKAQIKEGGSYGSEYQYSEPVVKSFPNNVQYGGATLGLNKMSTTDEYLVPAEKAAVPPKPESSSINTPILLAGASNINNNSMTRLMIYTGNLSLVVDSIENTLVKIKRLAESQDGYMQALGYNVITIKIPAQHFSKTVDEIEKMGNVSSREIQGEDVTDHMRDLNIRLDNALEFRKRLIKLLDKATKIQDALEIQRELERVTSEIELLKGKIQSIEHSIAFSKLTVYLNSELPQDQASEIIPFAWVRDLSAEVASPRNDNYSPVTSSRKEIKFDLPGSYIKFYQLNYHTRAMSAENVIIKIQRHKNYLGGDLEFWTTLAIRQLLEVKAFMVEDDELITLNTGASARLIPATKTIGENKYGYLAALVVTNSYVYTYEAWGPYDEFSADLSKLKESIKSMKIRN